MTLQFRIKRSISQHLQQDLLKYSFFLNHRHFRFTSKHVISMVMLADLTSPRCEANIFRLIPVQIQPQVLSTQCTPHSGLIRGCLFTWCLKRSVLASRLITCEHLTAGAAQIHERWKLILQLGVRLASTSTNCVKVQIHESSLFRSSWISTSSVHAKA